MTRKIPILVTLLALAACDGPGSTTDQPNEDADASPAATVSADSAQGKADSSAGGARDMEERNELIDFSYSYPEPAGAIPKLAKLLDSMLDEAHESITSSAREGRAEAQDSGFPFNQYWYHQDWKVVTETPAWLSLSSEISTYMGGAHGNESFDSLVWNKTDETKVDVLDLFSSPEALSEAVQEPFCEQLDRQRAAKRGTQVDRNNDNTFDGCIDPVEEGVIIVGSTDRRKFNRLGILVPPYAAGPYVEGTYEVTLPVTASVIEAVKPEYKDSFAPRN